MTQANFAHKIKGVIVTTARRLGDDDMVQQGVCETIGISLLNVTRQSFLSDGEFVAITVDLRALKPATPIDPANLRLPWFAGHIVEENVIELVLEARRFTWLDGTELLMALHDVVPMAEVGLVEIPLSIHGIAKAALTATASVILVAAPGLCAHAAVEAAELQVVHTPGSGGTAGNVRLILDLPPAPRGEPVMAAEPVLLLELKEDRAETPHRRPGGLLSGTLRVSASGWDSEAVAGSLGRMWRLSPRRKTMQDRVAIDLADLSIDAPDRNVRAHVHVLNFADAPDRHAMAMLYPAATAPGEGMSPGVQSFSADRTTIGNITQPQPVFLSWETFNTAFATLSGTGLVSLNATGFAVYVEATTVFVLTAYDAALQPLNSSTLTVTVAPDARSLLPTAGMIAIWPGKVDSVPTGWKLCDGAVLAINDYPALGALLGKKYGGDGTTTFGLPDLNNRFLVGATAASTVVPQTSGGPDDHTHSVGPFPDASSLTITLDSSGVHKHVFPSSWYARGLTTPYAFQSGTPGVVAPNFSQNSTSTKDSGSHTHTVALSFPQFTSGTNSISAPGIGVRPAWASLLHIIRL